MGKKGSGKNKGNSYEREICKTLSEWWSDGKDEDIFWRTASSGGMATQRSKRGKSAKNQQGDVQAIDPIGQPLIDAFTIEIKRGYSKDTISDLIDRPEKAKECQYEKFLKQVIGDSNSRNDNSSWLLIVKRDRREALIFLDMYIFKTLMGGNDMDCSKMPKTYGSICMSKNKVQAIIMKLNDFLKVITPEVIKEYYTRK